MTSVRVSMVCLSLALCSQHVTGDAAGSMLMRVLGRVRREQAPVSSFVFPDSDQFPEQQAEHHPAQEALEVQQPTQHPDRYRFQLQDKQSKSQTNQFEGRNMYQYPVTESNHASTNQYIADEWGSPEGEVIEQIREPVGQGFGQNGAGDFESQSSSQSSDQTIIGQLSNQRGSSTTGQNGLNASGSQSSSQSETGVFGGQSSSESSSQSESESSGSQPSSQSLSQTGSQSVDHPLSISGSSSESKASSVSSSSSSSSSNPGAIPTHYPGFHQQLPRFHLNAQQGNVYPGISSGSHSQSSSSSSSSSYSGSFSHSSSSSGSSSGFYPGYNYPWHASNGQFPPGCKGHGSIQPNLSSSSSQSSSHSGSFASSNSVSSSSSHSSVGVVQPATSRPIIPGEITPEFILPDGMCRRQGSGGC